MFKYYSVLIYVFLFLSCSDDDPTPGCFQEQGRKIVSIVNDIKGTIIFNEDCGYLVDPDEQLDKNPIGILYPCNLDMELSLDGSRVIFGGLLYESFEFEDICADFYEITDMETITED